MRCGSQDSKRLSSKAPFWARKETGSSCCMPTIKAAGDTTPAPDPRPPAPAREARPISTEGLIPKPAVAAAAGGVPKLLAWAEGRGIPVPYREPTGVFPARPHGFQREE